jgi:hypothetical protein
MTAAQTGAMMPRFVIKATPNGVGLSPRWLMPVPDNVSNFGTRDKAKMFTTHAEACVEASRWERMLVPAYSFSVEPDGLHASSTQIPPTASR